MAAIYNGPLNDVTVAAKSPHRKKSGLDTPTKKSVQTAKETPMKEMFPMQHPTNHPDLMRELGDMSEKLDVTVPRMLEVPGTVPTPPAGFTPNYFVNEFYAEPVPEFVDYSAPDIERPGYKILSSWTPEGGLRLFIDHEKGEPFTTVEVRDLITTLTGALDFVAEKSSSPTAPEGYRLAPGVSDVWTGEEIVNRNYTLMPAWNAATNQKAVELWTAKDTPDESYTSLAPLEALQLASDLIKLAKDALADESLVEANAEGK